MSNSLQSQYNVLREALERIASQRPSLMTDERQQEVLVFTDLERNPVTIAKIALANADSLQDENTFNYEWRQCHILRCDNTVEILPPEILG